MQRRSGGTDKSHVQAENRGARAVPSGERRATYPTGRIATSIVIPAYNEARRMEESLPRLIECFDWDNEEVILVDDGSKDDTVDVAERLLGGLPNTQIIRLGVNRGKGAAVRAGVRKARGRVIAYADADMASDPRGFERLIAALVDCEVAIGSRAMPESTVNCRDPSRVLFGRVFNRFVRTVTDLDLTDTQCGFKAFRAPAAKLLFHVSKIERYAFDVEILMLAHKLGMRAREVPVDWTDVKGSHVRPVSDSMPMAADVVRSEMRWRRARPVEAITIVSVTNGRRDGPPEVKQALRENLRYCDAVVSWPRGALALLPCLAPNEAALVRDRLAGKLIGCRVHQTSVSMEMLVHPSATPIMAALRSLPESQRAQSPVVCDEDTASLLLTSLGVA